MGFRDEQEAARARIEDLEAELGRLREERGTGVRKAPPFAILSVVLALAVTVLLSTLVATWSWRVDASHEADRLALQLAAEHYARQQATEASAACATPPPRPPPRDPPLTQADVDRQNAWTRHEEVREVWDGNVSERSGDAPALADQVCSIVIVRPAWPATGHGPHSGERCDVSVRCGEREIASLDDSPRPVRCVWNGSIRILDPFDDEGPTISRDGGTFALAGWRGHRGDPWSLRIEAHLR